MTGNFPEKDTAYGVNTDKKADLFYHIEKIGEIMEQAGGLNDLFLEFARPCLQVFARYTHLMEREAIILASILTIFEGRTISIPELARVLHCTPVQIFQYMDSLESLEQKGLILMNPPENGFSPFGEDFLLLIRVPFSTLDMLRSGEFSNEARIDNLTIEKFFIQVERLCEKRIQRRLSLPKSLNFMNDLLDSNMQLDFVRKLKSANIGKGDMFMLLRFFHYTITMDQKEMGRRELAALYDHYSEFAPVWNSLKRGNNILLTKDLIENAYTDGFSDAESFRLTDKTIDEFLGELNIDWGEKTSFKGVESVDSIRKKPLYYPGKTGQAIMELTTLLKHENFQNIQKRLAQSALRTGFACLFSGGPGTGKTETVYQIALKTGRDIISVDISSTKSKWFGESEKQIKQIFGRYRSCVKSYERSNKAVPILLFNEADAVIGKRRTLLENRNGPDQTENAIQNIILEELENLNGILIATTNLTQNMDSAFERRFLYKIEFEKPTVPARKLIWQSMIENLSDIDAEELAGRFDFSGGQIENIARRRTVDLVLNDSPPVLSKLITYCEDENKEKSSTCQIGFTAS